MVALLSEQKSILEELRRLDVEVLTENVQTKLASLQLQPSLLECIKDDLERVTLLKTIECSEKTKLQVDEQGVIRCGTKLWVPDSVLRKEVLSEAHR